MLDDIPGLLPDLRSLYEDLHANPELSFDEHRTAEAAGRTPRRCLGYDVTTGSARTGVVATMANGDGPTVLLRADIDALPVQEDTGLPYASTVTATADDGHEVPVAHACGHDMHATWMVGRGHPAGEPPRRSGRCKVLLLLQPAEEIGQRRPGHGRRRPLPERSGSRTSRSDSTSPRPPPAGCSPGAGPMMSAADSVRVVLHGRGGHGSSPEQTVDPVVMAASTVIKLQTVVSRSIAAD